MKHFNFFVYMYCFFVVVLFDCGVKRLDKEVARLVTRGYVHQNPYNKGWFLGPAPDYEKGEKVFVVTDK